jgi:hypothetical protein
MADGSAHRTVTVERIAQGVFTATNPIITRIE